MRVTLILLLLFVVAGCRTYGDHYGNEEALLANILEANERFGEELARAQGELAALESVEAFGDYAARYAAVAQVHEAILAEHRDLAEEAKEHDDNYRFLHRLYGAIISDQQIVKDRYGELVSAMARAAARDTTARAPVPDQSRYQVAPAFYERIAYENQQRSLAEILAEARGIPADTTASN